MSIERQSLSRAATVGEVWLLYTDVCISPSMCQSRGPGLYKHVPVLCSVRGFSREIKGFVGLVYPTVSSDIAQ